MVWVLEAVWADLLIFMEGEQLLLYVANMDPHSLAVAVSHPSSTVTAGWLSAADQLTWWTNLPSTNLGTGAAGEAIHVATSFQLYWSLYGKSLNLTSINWGTYRPISVTVHEYNGLQYNPCVPTVPHHLTFPTLLDNCFHFPNQPSNGPLPFPNPE